MKTSIFGISNKTRLIVESIENFCDEIEIFDFIVDYDFTNEQTDKRKIKINIENNLRNNFEILKKFPKSSDFKIGETDRIFERR